MARRVPWLGVGVGAVAGGLARLGLLSLHLQGGLRGAPEVLAYGVFVGVVVGALSGMARRPLPAAVLGAALSVFFSLVAYPFVALFSLFQAGSAAPWWELAAAGAVPGLLAGLAEQAAARRCRGAAPPPES